MGLSDFAILKQAEGGIPVAQLWHEHGMSSAIFCKWRSKFGGMDPIAAGPHKDLDKENRLLKHMYAEEKMKTEVVVESLATKHIGGMF